ncbi:hypothetical protein RE6C_03391 [Rhodopirellula europaea 6C]|uniref:Uncharacterized protein n=1 Tax=Rhodopirellula europaea 6C TaxID=1263867 RepID=M2ASV1_9BACT|nr:hypothetical protein RE6C_03391 [Rhodopirellula europaea 6C]
MQASFQWRFDSTTKISFENQPLGSIQLPTAAFSPPRHDSPRS